MTYFFSFKVPLSVILLKFSLNTQINLNILLTELKSVSKFLMGRLQFVMLANGELVGSAMTRRVQFVNASFQMFDILL